MQRSMAALADPAAAAQAAQQPDAVEESAKAQIEQVSLACGRYTNGASVKDRVDLPREQLHWPQQMGSLISHGDSKADGG